MMNSKILALTAITGFSIVGVSHAAVTPIGTPAYSLSSSTTFGSTHDNLPAAFLAQIAPGDITPSASSVVATFVAANLTDGDLGHGTTTSSWASASEASSTVTLDFAGADVAGIAINWAWGDRTPGDYEILVDGNSLGSINVDTAGGTSSAQSTEPNTYITFNSVQSGATQIQIIGTNGGGNPNSWGFDEVEVYTGVVPEPGSLALLGLGGLLIARRRRG